MPAQAVVGLAAVALVAADQWNERAVLLAPLKGQKAANPVAYTEQLKMLGLEVLGVLVITVVAGVNDTWASVAGVLILILWILFFINRKK